MLKRISFRRIFILFIIAYFIFGVFNPIKMSLINTTVVSLLSTIGYLLSNAMINLALAVRSVLY